MRWNGWNNLEEGVEVPYVFVLNLDIAKSKKLASQSHPVDHHTKINAFQREVQKLLNSDLIYKDGWTGDGLVVLYKHPEAKADELIKMALGIISLLTDYNKKGFFSVTVGMRIGIAVGTIIFQQQVGGIISDVMNKAGYLQKSCPGIGGVLITDGVYRFIGDSELKEAFRPTAFISGQEIRSVYYYPQDASDEVPTLITGTGITKEVDLSVLYGERARFSDIDGYLAALDELTSDAQEVILTGRAPVWLYLHAALKLKGKRRLLYRDGPGHMFEIFDYSLQ